MPILSAMSRLQFDMILRGQEVSLDVHVLPPEHDVGIMGYGFEDEVIRDRDGAILPWELTDDEIEEICEAVEDKVRSEEP